MDPSPRTSSFAKCLLALWPVPAVMLTGISSQLCKNGCIDQVTVTVGATRMPPRGAARRLHHIRLEHVC
jgi:hypothetical protein